MPSRNQSWNQAFYNPYPELVQYLRIDRYWLVLVAYRSASNLEGNKKYRKLRIIGTYTAK